MSDDGGNWDGMNDELLATPGFTRCVDVDDAESASVANVGELISNPSSELLEVSDPRDDFETTYVETVCCGLVVEAVSAGNVDCMADDCRDDNVDCMVDDCRDDNVDCRDVNVDCMVDDCRDDNVDCMVDDSRDDNVDWRECDDWIDSVCISISLVDVSPFKRVS